MTSEDWGRGESGPWQQAQDLILSADAGGKLAIRYYDHACVTIHSGGSRPMMMIRSDRTRPWREGRIHRRHDPDVSIFGLSAHAEVVAYALLYS
jgi:hypothetical protein